ncbi:MAG: response regulator transcription factor [Firmicutes bacterium]|nr:response regulator transcription factor [Bacillota bacterium]
MPSKPQILAVDDDNDILYTLGAIADLAGWKLHTATTGQEALLTYTTLSPDLIMVDYHMPGMDGVTLVRKIRALDGRVPIVILTVDDRHELAAQFRAAGASDFALKPIKAPDLISRIELNLELSAYQKGDTGQKGISTETMALVRKCLATAKEALTINEIAEITGLAYPTVYRYLNHLDILNVVKSFDDYGKVGRPKKRYKLLRGKSSSL